jgi:uncharacterized Fe-S cluster-containing protein
MYYDDKTDREILLIVADRTERLENTVIGKNRPGLVEDVAALKQEVDDIKETMTNVPGQKERWGMIGTVVVAALGIAAKILGIPLPV